MNWGPRDNPRKFQTRLDCTVWSTARELWRSDLRALAALLAIFAGAMPHAKLFALAITLGPKAIRRRLPAWAPRALLLWGKWAFFDVWVCVLALAVMQFSMQNGLMGVVAEGWTDRGVFVFLFSVFYSQALSLAHVGLLARRARLAAEEANAAAGKGPTPCALALWDRARAGYNHCHSHGQTHSNAHGHRGIAAAAVDNAAVHGPHSPPASVSRTGLPQVHFADDNADSSSSSSSAVADADVASNAAAVVLPALPPPTVPATERAYAFESLGTVAAQAGCSHQDELEEEEEDGVALSRAVVATSTNVVMGGANIGATDSSVTPISRRPGRTLPLLPSPQLLTHLVTPPDSPIDDNNNHGAETANDKRNSLYAADDDSEQKRCDDDEQKTALTADSMRCDIGCGGEQKTADGTATSTAPLVRTPVSLLTNVKKASGSSSHHKTPILVGASPMHCNGATRVQTNPTETDASGGLTHSSSQSQSPSPQQRQSHSLAVSSPTDTSPASAGPGASLMPIVAAITAVAVPGYSGGGNNDSGSSSGYADCCGDNDIRARISPPRPPPPLPTPVRTTVTATQARVNEAVASAIPLHSHPWRDCTTT